MKRSSSLIGALSLLSSFAIFVGAQDREARQSKGRGKKGDISPLPPIFPNDSLVFEGINEPRVRREWRTLSLTERLKVST
jgi:hypothetical protein